MANDRWNNDDYDPQSSGGQRSGRQYGYGYDNDRMGDRDQRSQRDEQYRDRYRPYGSSDRDYGGGGWINEYSTDWRRYADRDYPSGRGYDRDDWRHERGWWDRTKDEVRSWMGDSQAEQRRQADHSGRGPKGYTRSDERIREDVSDRLMEDWGVDATDIEVTVTSAEVTLSGTVDGRESKRRAENIAATVLGVQDVQNNLRVRKVGVTSGTSSTEIAGQTGGTTSSSVGTTGTTAGNTTPRH
jgi:osmotically-inducible protein OsmY